MKTLAISANLTSFSLDNLFTGALPDRVIIGLVDDRDIGGSYGRNPFNFQRFNVTNMQLKRNGTLVPREGYKQTFGDSKYIRSYMTFQSQLGGLNGDTCVALTPNEWANGYTVYAFKVTDGPIGSGTGSPRSRANQGSCRLEITFSQGNAENIKVVVLSESFGQLEFDQYKQVTIT